MNDLRFRVLIVTLHGQSYEFDSSEPEPIKNDIFDGWVLWPSIIDEKHVTIHLPIALIEGIRVEDRRPNK